MAHRDAQEGKWRGNWRMEWIASTLHTTSEHGVSSITTADAHTSADSSWLNWRLRQFLNGLVRFAKRRNLISARLPSHFNWPLQPFRRNLRRPFFVVRESIAILPWIWRWKIRPKCWYAGTRIHGGRYEHSSLIVTWKVKVLRRSPNA